MPDKMSAKLTHTYVHTYRAKHTVNVRYGCCNLSSASDPQSWLSAIASWPTNQSTAHSPSFRRRQQQVLLFTTTIPSIRPALGPCLTPSLALET